MTDFSTAKYVIDSFDPKDNVVFVRVLDEENLAIRLMHPYPTNAEELDALIQHHIMPLEVAIARAAPPGDVSFIEGLVGAEREVKRISYKPS